MGKYLMWLLLAAIAVVVFLLVFNYVRREARPLIESPEELMQIEKGELTNVTEVIITLEDSRYHRKGCPEIGGATELTTVRVAEMNGVRPCPYCID